MAEDRSAKAGCSMDDSKTLITTKMAGYFKRKQAEAQTRDVAQYWSYPKGIEMPALVLHINEYVDYQVEPVFIPGELAIVSFTVSSGLHKDHYWTLIDPVHIPLGHGMEAMNCMEKYSLPQTNFSSQNQDFKKIVSDLESYIKSHGKPISRDSKDLYMIFCLKEKIAGFQRGLEWLYSLAEENFPHELVPLESLFVTLSVGGLTRLYKKGKANPAEEKFLEFIQKTELMSRKVSGCVSGRSMPTSEERLKADRIFEDYLIKFSYTHVSVYSERRASSRRLEHPDAYIGAILFDESASRYMDMMDFIHYEELCCEYHRRKQIPQDLTGNLMQPPADKQITCALAKLNNMVFLILDVILINFNVEPIPGAHKPEQLPTAVYQLMSINERKKKYRS